MPQFSKFKVAFLVGGSSLLCISHASGIKDNVNKKLSLLKAACRSSENSNNIQFGRKWNCNWDKRDQFDVVDSSVKKTKKHYLFIRHGQYNMNGYNDDERYLTDLGREQAKMTGKRLAALNLNYSKVVQSSMKRAKETCQIIMDQIPDHPSVETSDLLREGSPIPPVPAHRSNEPELKYFSDSLRIESAFRKFIHRPTVSCSDEPVELVVCHANVIRYFVCRVTQFPPEAWLRMSLKHGSITWVTVYSDGDVVVNGIGDSGFMPPDKLTS